MDSLDEAYFNEIMGNNLITDITTIQKRLEELFKEAVQSEVYDYYNPIEYERSYMFLNSIKSHVNADGDIYIYSDINSGYYSAVTGEDVSQYISGWIERGHSDGKGTGQYHSYEPRLYLEKARAIIEAEFPMLNVEIIEDDNF